MPAMYHSVFRPFSKGIVTENMDFLSHVIQVTCLELLPAQDGEMTSRFDNIEAKGTDEDGKAYAKKAKVSSSIQATWMPNGSNRITAPSVRRNEAVMIWATADHGEYRWTPIGDDDDMRNTEVVIFGFRAAKDYSVKPTQTESMYVLEINTERGLVAFSTTVDRGEYTRMATVFDTKDGTFTYEDGVENKFFSDAKENLITISNKYGSEVGIHKERTWLKAPGMVSIMSPYTQIEGVLNVMGGTISNGYSGPPPNGWVTPDR